ncbi:MAG: lysine--tRNA ligase [Clostridiales bacterium]|jgi:lysyl-tRNA synthetase class 2|nr:lysine--tRNA ligase [Clostridiales bacterium]
MNELLRQRREKLEQLQKEGKNPFDITTFEVDRHSAEIVADFAALEGARVRIAGRMMSRRTMGKAAFCDLQDGAGRIQVYIKRENVGDEAYADFDKKWDIGDIFGVAGVVFKTQKGEISVKAESVVLLTKSLQILPEKYHGLTNVDMRYRRRYLDLIVNPEVREAFIKRSAIIKGIRNFLDSRNFMEVETPILTSIPGGASARPFATHHNALHLDMSLRIALEIPLKKLVVGGFERVYEIGRCFRNEGISTLHNPEFTMLELYQAYTDFHGMMELTESLLRRLAVDVTGSGIVEYQGQRLDFERPFAQISMVEAVRKYAGVDFDAIDNLEEARAIARQKGVEFAEIHAKGDILNLFFEKFAEEQLIQPTFVTDHPIEISYLCKAHPDKPAYAQRFELFIMGREFANAYSELNDSIDQRLRFERQEALRAAGDDEAARIDEEFIHALEVGLPPSGGLGIGIDRLAMILTDSPSIRDVLFFPAMKPKETA